MMALFQSIRTYGNQYIHKIHAFNFSYKFYLLHQLKQIDIDIMNHKKWLVHLGNELRSPS